MEYAGKVSLVGAGPGNFGLLTLRALELIRSADVILFDHLIPMEVFAYLQENCELIDVSKHSGNHSLPQEKINDLLIKKAKEGKLVVRLKGGDPFVFGRGGEEALALHKSGIPYEIVPGITSGVAVPAYAGIPVSHRKKAVNIHFVTAHEAEDKRKSQVRWDLLAKDKYSTIVGYMGVKTLPYVIEMLKKYGMHPETPAAVIRFGTTSEQKALSGNISTIAEIMEESNFRPPALFIIGEVAGMSEELCWVQNLGMFGKRIVIARDLKGARHFTKIFRPLGADVFPLPVIKINLKISESTPKNNLRHFDWCIFTSSNGVKAFFNYLREINSDIREFPKMKFAVIGKATADFLRSMNVKTDFVPGQYTSRGFLRDFLREHEVKGKTILRVRGNLAPSLIEDTLRQEGANMETWTLYETLPVDPPFPLKRFLSKRGFDIITFTSSSTFRNFLRAFGEEEGKRLLKKARIYSIGPETSHVIREAGCEIRHEADVHTVQGLIDCILSHELQNGDRE